MAPVDDGRLARGRDASRRRLRAGSGTWRAAVLEAVLPRRDPRRASGLDATRGGARRASSTRLSRRNKEPPGDLLDGAAEPKYDSDEKRQAMTLEGSGRGGSPRLPLQCWAEPAPRSRSARRRAGTAERGPCFGWLDGGPSRDEAESLRAPSERDPTRAASLRVRRSRGRVAAGRPRSGSSTPHREQSRQRSSSRDKAAESCLRARALRRWAKRGTSTAARSHRARAKVDTKRPKHCSGAGSRETTRPVLGRSSHSWRASGRAMREAPPVRPAWHTHTSWRTSRWRPAGGRA